MSTAFQAVPETKLVAGRYRPLQPLGSGGSGSVWLAQDEQTGLQVALKIIGKEGKAASRAQREAQAAARLRHPHVLRAYGFGSDSRHVYIPYEYVSGHTLRVAMRARELDERGLLEAAAQVLDALAYAHANGIVHRDVKPSNVLVADGPGVSVRLFDFGLAQLAGAETLTAVGDVPGTLAYISPERLRGKPAGPAADVWAAGVLVWEALTGAHPFFHDSPVETGKQIQAGAPSIAAARPDLPPQLVEAVDAALAQEPGQRPTAAAFAAALREAFAERERARPASLRPRVDVGRALRIGGSVAAAALFAGVVSATLPFYPARWPLLLAAVAGGLTAVRARLGLAFALAVPILPLGNYSLGLALAYVAAAALWLAVAWRRPRSGLAFASGLLLAPVGCLALLPLVLRRVDGWFRRGACAAAAVLVAGGGADVERLPIAGNESPLAAADAVWNALAGTAALGRTAIVLAVAAAALPYCERAGELAIAAFGAGVTIGLVLAAPETAPWLSILLTWATTAFLIASWRRNGGRATTFDGLAAHVRTARASGEALRSAVSPRRTRLAHATRR